MVCGAGAVVRQLAGAFGRGNDPPPRDMIICLEHIQQLKRDHAL